MDVYIHSLATTSTFLRVRYAHILEDETSMKSKLRGKQVNNLSELHANVEEEEKLISGKSFPPFSLCNMQSSVWEGGSRFYGEGRSCFTAVSFTGDDE